MVLSLSQYSLVPGKPTCRQIANMTVPSVQDSQNGRKDGEMAYADYVRRSIMLEPAKKNPNQHLLHLEAKVPNPTFRQMVVLLEKGAT